MMDSFIYNSPLGQLHISANEEYIISVRFGEPSVASENSELHQITTVPDHPLLQICVQQLDDYFNGINLQFDLPLQQPGTKFQQQVWAGLLNIKAGNTISYLTFSKQLGNAKAIRAVGTANGRNNIAIIVPCHRVIGSNGHLVGYAGELWRKKWLLQHEAKYCNGVQDLFETTSLHQ